MKYFVSADIHGYYDEWILALEKEKFDVNNPEHMIIVCGDLFDRGEQAKEVQAFIMDLLGKGKIILIKGNHEELALELIDHYADYVFNVKSSHHWKNGTFQTLLDLTGMSYYEATTCLLGFKKYARETDYVKEIIPRMKNYYETDNHVFVHSWIPLKRNFLEFDEDWRNAEEETWKKARWVNPVELYKNGLYPKGKTLVLGHWHCSAFWAQAEPAKYSEFGEKANFEPFITKDVIALDSCTKVSGKVNVLVITDTRKNGTEK